MEYLNQCNFLINDNYPSKEVFDQQVDNQGDISTYLSNEQKLKAEIWTNPLKNYYHQMDNFIGIRQKLSIKGICCSNWWYLF